jgi:hypothetical protein
MYDGHVVLRSAGAPHKRKRKRGFLQTYAIRVVIAYPVERRTFLLQMPESAYTNRETVTASIAWNPMRRAGQAICRSAASGSTAAKALFSYGSR